MAGKIRYMNTGDRPIYSYTFGNEIIYILCASLSVAIDFFSWVVSCALVAGNVLLVPLMFVVIVPTSFLVGFGVTKAFFFVKRRIFFVAGFQALALGMLAASGFVSCFSCDFSTRDVTSSAAGLAMLGLVVVLVSWCFTHVNRICLFTDGVIIGKLVIPYKDVVTVAYATGKDVASRVPQEGKGLELIILTPLDFEYIERDFGIFHHYVIIVTKERCYVAQSLSSRSDFPANVRNAWACYDYDMKHGIIHPLH